jgi:hypothetical protein
LPQVVDLANSFGGIVNVSPAKSATSGTEVTVEQPIMSFVDRIRIEVEKSMEGKLRQQIREAVRDPRRNLIPSQSFQAPFET